MGVLAEPPPLGPDEAQASHCWNFCGGWAPERWPLYHALHPVADWPLLVDLMQAIRGAQHG